MMDIPLNVDVHCPDGRCGRSTFIILNPATQSISHLVVREQWPSRVERLVPVDWIAVTTRDVIVLQRDRNEFTQLAPFNQTEFLYTNVPHHAADPKMTLIWPFVVPAMRIVDDRLRRIPAGELAVRRGAKVRATDGPVGQVDEFMVEEDSGLITHLVLREGYLGGQKLVTIPLDAIKHVEEKTVFLNLSRKDVEALPSIPVR